MNIALWIIAGVLAALFLVAGLTKAAQPKRNLAANMAWVEDFSDSTIKLIGVAEILGAVGLILPAALDIAPILTPLAASGLAVTMVLAAVVHARRQEYPMIAVNVVLFALTAFVAVMRFGPQAF
ncbi:DoxX-like protein [Mumia flava]|uniref:DoxX-like protein n=1 Tax=Mumia flava TaxID=1348852 RepID=A0A0B2BVN2_9ACTN|nr:DoxX family protein [Mumia flava]PJJ54212.1 DoxX-like protein [Mumia flava]